MIKGCRKNVVWIRNTGSDMFEEAYFIVSDKKTEKNTTDCDMLTEANRLIAESPVAGSFYRDTQRHSRKVTERVGVGKAVWFMLGASVTTALNAVIYFIV